MKDVMKRLLFLALWVPLILSAQIDERYLEVKSSLKTFVCDVVYKVEEGDRDSKARRWTTMPKIHINAEGVDPKMVKDIFEKNYNLALGQAKPGGEVFIHIGKRADLHEIAEDYGLDLNGSWQYWTWWNGKSEINKAVILIASDRKEDIDRLISLTCIRSLGIPSSSKKRYESILSEKFEDAKQLTPFDQHLIKFYYTQVPPGITRGNLRPIIENDWSKGAN